MEGAFWKILIPAEQGASLLKLYLNLSLDLDFRVFICFTSFVGSAGFFTKGLSQLSVELFVCREVQ